MCVSSYEIGSLYVNSRTTELSNHSNKLLLLIYSKSVILTGELS